uniref:Uncharacterized protein n=1 Tax=Arundo donax TaxID=35708 RepID=A0A0A9BFU2_ARUDO
MPYDARSYLALLFSSRMKNLHQNSLLSGFQKMAAILHVQTLRVQ